MTRPVVIETIAALRDALAGREVALVPTMGALHEGHLELVAEATRQAETVVVSIFVNPLQFGQSEDLTRYPRDLESDLDALAPHGVAYVFAPSAEEMYPDGATATRVTGARANSSDGLSQAATDRKITNQRMAHSLPRQG